MVVLKSQPIGLVVIGLHEVNRRRLAKLGQPTIEAEEPLARDVQDHRTSADDRRLAVPRKAIHRACAVVASHWATANIWSNEAHRSNVLCCASRIPIAFKSQKARSRR